MWFPETSYSWWESFLMYVLKCGPIPKHLAIIMDGNRRFAQKSNLEKIEGHKLGFQKMTQTLQWCCDFGIKEVTVFAFSIENFNRSQNEIDELLSLAQEKFNELLKEKEILDKYGIRVRILGDVTLLPLHFQIICDEIEKSTKDNDRYFLNVAIAYTSRYELCRAIRLTAAAVNDGRMEIRDISKEKFENFLYTKRGHSKVDLLIRTSGEVRLSDFMLWQSSYGVTHFTPSLWPEFTLLQFMVGIFHYQQNISRIQSILPDEEEIC